MPWLLLGTAILAALILGLRAFERMSASAIVTLLKWIAAFAGLALTGLLLLSGRGPQALTGLVLVGPLLWRRWHQGGFGTSGLGGAGFGGSAGTPPPQRRSSTLTRSEALEVLGLKPGASDDDIHAAHRRLMRMAHPDTGGSDWLASRINQARDVLLG